MTGNEPTMSWPMESNNCRTWQLCWSMLRAGQWKVCVKVRADEKVVGCLCLKFYLLQRASKLAFILTQSGGLTAHRWNLS